MATEIVGAFEVFSSMEPEVLNAIKVIATSAQAGLNGLKAQKEALSLSLDISLIPLRIKREALDTIIGAARDKTQIIPADSILQCPPLGAINTNFEASLLGQLEGVQNMLFEIDRLVSEKTMVVAQIAQMDAGVKFLDSVIQIINEVLSAV